MANTNMTFDVAILFVPADVRLARFCARHLTRNQLRVTLIPCDPLDENQYAIGREPTLAARATAAIVGRQGAASWMGMLPGSVPWLDSGITTLLGPGLAAGTVRHFRKYLPGRAWDLRAVWEDDVSWNAVGRSLFEIGYVHETRVEACSPLAPVHLKRMTISSYDAIAEQFSDYWFDHPPQHELDQFLRRLTPNSSVLDAGCGPGHHAQILARAGHNVVAIDLSGGMLTQARRRVRSIRLLWMDMQELKFNPGTFDAIWCSAAAHHAPREELLPMLEGFRRVLKSGGLLGLNLQVRRRSEIVERKLDHRFFEYHRHGGEIADLLHAAGFVVEADLAGKSRRNTHSLDMVLNWSTLYARSGLGPNLLSPAVPRQDRSA